MDTELVKCHGEKWIKYNAQNEPIVKNSNFVTITAVKIK